MSMPAGGVAAALGVVALSLTVIGCGNDDRAQGESRATTTAPATTTTQPPATDTEAVRPVIEELLRDYDQVLADVLVDPGQVEDPGSSLMDDLDRVFTQAHLGERLAVFRDNAAVGRVFEPIEDQPLWVTAITGEIVADGDDALAVPVCTTYSYLLTGPEGAERKEGFPHPGNIEAERVDGTWKISWTDEDPLRFCDPAATGDAR